MAGGAARQTHVPGAPTPAPKPGPAPAAAAAPQPAAPPATRAAPAAAAARQPAVESPPDPKEFLAAITAQISALTELASKVAAGQSVNAGDLHRATVRATPRNVYPMIGKRQHRNLEVDPLAPLPVPEKIVDEETGQISYENAPTYLEAMADIKAGRLKAPVFTRDRGFIVE